MLKLIYTFLPLFMLFSACSEAHTTSAQTHADGETNKITLALTDTAGLAKATFAGGCFWCTEAFFERLQGVEQVVSGYAGGDKPNPTYQEVSSGNTGYAECVQIYYDPNKISYQDLLEVFFATHDPTQLNRQGPDVGEQYRSVVFYHNQEQKQQAQQYVKSLEEASAFLKQIVTKVEPVKNFAAAEEYHQDFYEQNPSNRYMQQVAEPKMKKFEEKFKEKLKN